MSIAIHHLSYIHPDKEVLFQNISLSVHSGQKVSLIGNNGSGKSTLLRIMACMVSPSAGNVHYPPSGIYYVPQHFGQYDHLTIAGAMQVEKKIEALHAILSGKADEEYFTALNDEWNIEEDAKAALHFWGLQHCELSQPLKDLSGGEKTKVFLAGMKVHNESFILLDEPTNHLDYQYREKLYEWIKTTKSTMIVVSHDRTLLNLLSLTYELLPNEVKIYGGNYEFYKEQKNMALIAMQEKLDEKQKQLRQAKKIAIETAERQQKHSSRGEKQSMKKGISRIAMGNLKDKSERSSSKLKDIHAEKTAGIESEIRNLRKAACPPSALKTDFNSSSLHSGKILIAAENINFGYTDKMLWEKPLNFIIRSGERLLVEGNNGSGKTTLLKLITGKETPSRGCIKRSEGFSYVYLDQGYSIIRNDLSILEQAESFKPSHIPEHQLKTILNRFLFPPDSWDKLCCKLSGGEKMRLSFCCLMISNNTPDMFILDEPTNNLDIQSIDIITSTIKGYAGTVLAISHDTYFVKEIGVERKICL